MPTYEYRCRDCGHTFEKVIGIREHERGEKPQCPRCKSHRIEQRPTVFQAVTNHKT